MAKEPHFKGSEKLKTVCHITTVHTVKDTRIYHKECRALAEAGYSVKLIAINAADVVSDYPNVEIINVPFESTSKIKRILHAPKRARIVAQQFQPEVYHFHDPEFLFAGLKLSRSGARVIYDSHEDVPNQI
ncbi:MAG TPA: glycosyl transferase, partial [Flavobacteriales bacterium]|nr:glycosyl transferase [Flavobacteriales bacterium]